MTEDEKKDFARFNGHMVSVSVGDLCFAVALAEQYLEMAESPDPDWNEIISAAIGRLNAVGRKAMADA